MNNSNLQKYMINNNEKYYDINNYVYDTNVCKNCNKGELNSCRK